MRKFLLIAIAVLVPASLAAQTPVADVFGGYSYKRAQTAGLDAVNMHGWNAAFQVNASSWFGIVADFSGHYGTTRPPVETDFNIHNFLFGPQITYRSPDAALSPFARVMLGGSRGASRPMPGAPMEAETEFAWAAGGGVDINVSESAALRVFQIDYIQTRFGDTTQNNTRISVGVVFRLGGR